MTWGRPAFARTLVARNEDRSREISMISRLQSLAHQHEKLEQRINAEIKNSMPNHSRLQELKRQKLRIKDEMQRLLRTQHEAARNPASGLLRPE